jgi:alpha-beta hydrolase superfamily lysophospholipase
MTGLGAIPGAEPVTFEAADGLLVRADFFESSERRGCLVLCHRSHFNRGEYATIAPRLQQHGYRCLALDQRSGMNVLGYVNETSSRAKARQLATGYLAATLDIEAAIQYARSRNRGESVVLVGSSYSAALALVIASSGSGVKAVAAFSPGEYLKGVAVSTVVAQLRVPTFVTAARKELADVKQLMRAAPRAILTWHAPRADGAHGARCLWATTAGSDSYWKAFTAFLDRVCEARPRQRTSARANTSAS